MNTEKFIYNSSKALVLFSCINTAIYKINPEYSIVHHIIHEKESIKYFYILIGLLAFYLLLCDKSINVIPAAQNNNSIDTLLNAEATLFTYNIRAPDADHLIWWITDELNNKIYDNSGISIVNEKGISQIVIPLKNKKNNLLRFREIQGGILGDVKTIFLN